MIHNDKDYLSNVKNEWNELPKTKAWRIEAGDFIQVLYGGAPIVIAMPSFWLKPQNAIWKAHLIINLQSKLQKTMNCQMMLGK